MSTELKPRSRDSDRRTATRHDVHVDVSVDGETGVSQNISSSGILLVGQIEARVGAVVELELELPTLFGAAGGHIRFTAEVVRVEDDAEGTRVAAQFNGWKIVDSR